MSRKLFKGLGPHRHNNSSLHGSCHMVNKAHWPHIRQKHVKFCRADKLLCITCRKGREVPSRPRPSRVNPSFRIMSRPGFETLSPGPTPVMTGVGTPSPRPILVVSPSRFSWSWRLQHVKACPCHFSDCHAVAGSQKVPERILENTQPLVSASFKKIVP